MTISISILPSEPDSPAPISAEDMLENQENIAIDEGLFEIGDDEDVDMFADMPHLQEVSDSEDGEDGEYFYFYIKI